jgi:hypothetical protein
MERVVYDPMLLYLFVAIGYSTEYLPSYENSLCQALLAHESRWLDRLVFL